MGLLFYYKDKDDVQQGPFDSKELRALIKVGAILPLTDLRTDKMNDRWVHAFNLKNAFPDYVPSQEQPSPPQKTWGTRYAIHLLKNPVMIIAILGVFGMVLAAYRARELPWLFPPNKMPSPVASVDLVEEIPEPLVKGNADEKKEEGKEEPKPADPLSGNSPAGQIHRGIMGDQWCIQPSRMFPLPENLPEGRFFFRGDKDRVIFSALAPWENFNENAWPLQSVLINNYGGFEKEHATCRITSYSQINRNFSFIASVLEGLPVVGGLDDWKKLAGYDRKINYQINTSLRPIFPGHVESRPSGNVFAVYESPKIVDSQKVTIASFAVSPSSIAHQYQTKIAISALYPDEDATASGQSSDLDKYHRLMVISSTNGNRLVHKYGETLSSLGNDLDVLAEALPYQEIVFSQNADFLAGYKANGRIDVYRAETLDLVFRVPGVSMGGPYHRNGGAKVKQFSGHRLSFSPREDLLLANDQGHIVLIDIRTKEVRRISLRGRVQTYCFDDYGQIMAASTETGEIYRIDPHSGKVIAKASVAGLGPLTTYLNFSANGDYLSGIFNERLYASSNVDKHGIQPTMYAMFWYLDFLRGCPISQVTTV